MTAPAATDDELIQPDDGGDPAEPQPCQFDDKPAVQSLLWRDGEAYTPACAEHLDEAKQQIEEAGETVSGVVDIQPAVTAAAVEFVEQADPDAGEWRVRFPVMALEGLDTSDGRYLTPGTIIARAVPMSILAQPFASHGGQEPPPAVVVGRLDSVERVPGPSVTSRVTGEPFPDGSFVWVGHGAVDPSIDVHGLNIGNLLKRRFLNGASVDLAGMDVEMVGEEGFDADPDNPRRQMIANRAEQAAITLVPIPAFGDAYVELVGDDEPMVPASPEEFPEGFAASAFPAWRSAEVGDYPALVAAGEQHTGGMVALVPDDVDALTVEGGEPADELHLTLAYLGDDVTGWDDAQRQTVLDHVQRWAEGAEPVDGDVMGWALFNPTGANDRTPCAVHLVSGAGLPEAKAAMGEHEQSEHPVFLPHITAGYGVPIDALSYVGPVRFSKVRVALGGDVTDYELGATDAPPVEADNDALLAAAPSAQKRAKAEDEGDTYPGTDRFPIDTRERAKSAVRLHGSSDLPAEKVKAWLKRRLKTKGWDDLIPESWSTDGAALAAEPAERLDDMGTPDAPQVCEYGDHPAERSLIYRDGERYVATCTPDEDAVREWLTEEGETVTEVVEIEQENAA